MNMEKLILVKIGYNPPDSVDQKAVYKQFAVKTLETLLPIVRDEFNHYDGRSIKMTDLLDIGKTGVIQLRPRLKPITIGELKLKLLFLEISELELHQASSE